jgi:hypothetical protein
MGQLDEIANEVTALNNRTKALEEAYTGLVAEVLFWRDNAHRIAEEAHYNGYQPGLKVAKQVQHEAWLKGQNKREKVIQGREEK